MNLCKDLSFTVTEKAPTYDFSVIVPISTCRGLIDKAPYLKMYLSLSIFVGKCQGLHQLQLIWAPNQ